MKRYPSGLFALTLISGFLSGCGGGHGEPTALLAGAVTDIDGRQAPGATVSSGNKSTTSLSNGTYTLDGIREGFRTVVASTTINGHRWSGQTDADVIADEQNRNVNVVVSDERSQGSISGSVIDPSGFGLPGAKVFIGGPFGSTLAITDENGNYRADRLTSAVTYTVTASLAGFVNDTKTVHVDPGVVNLASFALSSSTAAGALPAASHLTAQAWTVADTLTRATGPNRPFYAWLKDLYRQKRGIKLGTPSKAIKLVHPAVGRATPAGAVIEVDLFWDPLTEAQVAQTFKDLFGYAIERGVSQNNLSVTALLRDPLTSVFFDADLALTPDVTYSYTVNRLDTIGFPDPSNGQIGPPSNVASATPLGPIQATGPVGGAVTSSVPVFHWTTLTGAAGYQLFVWDRFPALMFDPAHPNEPNAVAPLWPVDLNNPGSSFVLGGAAASMSYQGPPLQSGHTYYWMVLAVDNANSASIGALSASAIEKFAVQ